MSKRGESQSFVIGTAQFGSSYGIANQHGKVTDKEMQGILAYAQETGVKYLDTAAAYGDSEAKLGQSGVKSFNVVTKLPVLPHSGVVVSAWVNKHVNESLHRLQLKKLYGLLVHHSPNLMGQGGLQYGMALRRLKERGLVRKLGISIYDPSELEYVLKVLDVDLVQAPLNVIDRRLQTSGWLSRLKDAGIEVHARSVFLQGLLLMSRFDIPQKFERWSGTWDRWQQYLNSEKIDALSACLSYPLSVPEVNRVVVGVESAQQLTDIITAAEQIDYSIDTSFMVSSDKRLINPSRWSAL